MDNSFFGGANSDNSRRNVGFLERFPSRIVGCSKSGCVSSSLSFVSVSDSDDSLGFCSSLSDLLCVCSSSVFVVTSSVDSSFVSSIVNFS
jgi:hypothetical protein